LTEQVGELEKEENDSIKITHIAKKQICTEVDFLIMGFRERFSEEFFFCRVIRPDLSFQDHDKQTSIQFDSLRLFSRDFYSFFFQGIGAENGRSKRKLN
jgi:hypothetical protein